MRISKIGKYLTSVPVCAWGVADKLSELLGEREDTNSEDLFSVSDSLRKLKESGVISDEEYEKLKERVAEYIR